MARVRYVSRTRGGHDARWVDTLRHAGHTVDVRGVPDAGAPGEEVALVVAGPVTDAVPAALAADVAPVLAIVWAVDLLVEASDPAVRRAVAGALPACVGVHVDCEAMRREAIGLGADPTTISLAAWGVDTDYFTPAPALDGFRAGHGLEDRHRVVLSNRSWEPLYAIPVVLEGFARAHAADSRLRLVLAGDGSATAEVHAVIERLGLGPLTLTPGRMDRSGLRTWLHASDAFVGAATSDGTSLSLLEALACGVPAVVPDIGGNPEWVDDPVRGRLFPPGDAGALAASLQAVLAMPATSSARQARRAPVLERGSWPRNRELFLEAVERALAVAR